MRYTTIVATMAAALCYFPLSLRGECIWHPHDLRNQHALQTQGVHHARLVFAKAEPPRTNGKSLSSNGLPLSSWTGLEHTFSSANSGANSGSSPSSIGSSHYASAGFGIVQQIHQQQRKQGKSKGALFSQAPSLICKPRFLGLFPVFSHHFRGGFLKWPGHWIPKWPDHHGEKVPAPSSLVLFAAALPALLLICRRYAKHHRRTSEPVR